ncbi:MAG TPA: efflux transporter periplasmic adaptor subunit [Opitutae bacterium]|nr:efflux transporter periplasmic adaptor subunit [Opitutae bacterium]
MNPKSYLFIGAAIVVGLIAGRYLIPKSSKDHTAHDSDSTTSTSTEPSIWTCSMHPQIQQPDSGDCPICGMDLIPLSNDSHADAGPREMSMSESSKALANVQTSVVVSENATRPIRLVGQLKRADTNVKSLTARFPARIESLAVDAVGITVEQGQTLAQIYSPELLSAQRELLAAYQRDPEGRFTQLAREKLLQWDVEADQIDAILKSGAAPKTFELRSPINGVVVEKNINEGDYLKTGQALYTIVGMSELWLTLAAYETDLPWLAVGQSIEFTTQSTPGQTFVGEIEFIEPEVDPATRTIPVRALVPNPENQLKPGMFARATVQASKSHESEPPLLVPASSVLRTGKRAVVYVEKPNAERPTYEGREIVLGPRAGDHFIVVKGLEAGEHVVTKGAFKIDSALQIQAKPSMMNPQGGGPTPGHNHGDAAPEPDSHAGHTMPSGIEIKLDTAKAILPNYLELQNALASDDLEKSKSSLKDMMQNTGHSGALPDLIHTMFAASDLDTIRKPHFETLSNALIASVKESPKAFGQNLFIMNCPMVYGNTGADWLQSDDDLLNPYFGAMMLRCGKLKETIKND